MKKHVRFLLSGAIFIAIFLMVPFFGTNQATAQPTNYCLVCPQPGFTYNYCVDVCYYTYYGTCCPISFPIEVTLLDAGGGVVFTRQSLVDNGHFIEKGAGHPLNIGESYTLKVKVRMFYYQYGYTYTYPAAAKVWIDWNQDGDWFDAGERINPSGWYKNHLANTDAEFTIPFTVNSTATPGKTKMRVIGAYYTYDYGPCAVGYTYAPNYNYGYYGEAEDYILDIQAGVSDTYPSEGDILFADESYNDVRREKSGVFYDFFKPQVMFSSEQKAGSKCTFKITGPAPSTSVVYEGVDPNNGSTEFDVGLQGSVVTVPAAQGTFADGIDGSFKANQGGTYTVDAFLIGSPQHKIQRFTVSWDNDHSVSSVVSPRSNEAPRFFKYLRGQTVKVSAKYTCVGIYDVTSFDAIARIYNSDGDMIYYDSVRYDAPPNEALSTGESTEIEFRSIRLNDIGQYSAQFCSNLLSASDQDSYNDCIPRADQNEYTFEIAHEIQLRANQIFRPSQDQVLLANRPVLPWAEFKNLGIGDASDIPVSFKVYKLPNLTNPVYESNIIIQDIQAGTYNTKNAFFDQMVLKEEGEYQACITITAEEDIVREDDSLCITFFVEGGLQGVYTVGSKYFGNSRNFSTIDSAMNALYFRGVIGPVVFEFTDSRYDLTSAHQDGPAWDLTSRIIGVGWDPENERYNTLTWRVHRSLANVKGGVTINLNSYNGQGLKFGQSLIPTNRYAVAAGFPSTTNANSEGHIIFDGGSQKALKLVLYSNSAAFGSPVYLSRGSKNISIKNLIIENGTPAIARNTYLPLVIYDPTRGFVFEADSTTGSNPMSYSAGVVLRSSLLKFEDSNFLNLDTIPNQNNVIEGNDISGFGYGIVSLGMGNLFLQNEAIYQRFYNKDNLITGNTIHDISLAGIFAGYEENTEISHNRIYDIGNGSDEAYGIMLGGASRDDIPGYNNVILNVDGNEISGLNADEMVIGIKSEQVRNSFQNPAGGLVYFPDIEENLMIVNNVIWGMEINDADGAMAGIHVMTERDYDQSTMMDVLMTPSKMDYLTRNDKIANNTILISDDGGTNNTGIIAGIGLQHVHNASVMNNAIAILDNSIDANNPINAAIFYQGRKPMDGGINGDRNAFWFGNSGAAAYRFIETDEDNEIIELGDRNEFETLNQWQLWTGGEPNSIVSDFTNDLVFQGNNPQSLRINMVPEAPRGSILDNRGDRLDFVNTDIDGNVRGAAGQRYDIGAFEFLGRMYVSDVEMISLPTPGAYKSGSGTFSDAEYIMTTAPVEVQARVRNNGSLQQSGVNFRVQIYREMPNGLYNDVAYIDETIQADIATTESADIYFNLADGLGVDFVPQTYADLAPDYNVPVQFSTMQANVTPKYMIKISIESDQNNANNIISKEVRFYLRKSPLRLLISSENSFADLYYSGTPTADQIAGRLNADSLYAGMKRLGWYTDIDQQRYDVDQFDRKGWEPKSVNYTMYRSLFWTDGDDKALTRYEKMDIDDFLNVGNDVTKKNIVIGSQEMVRSNSMGNDYDPDFLHTVLRSEYQAPGNPLGSNVSNDGNSVMGITIGRDLTEDIMITGYANDMPPYCGVMSLFEEGEGLSQVAYAYVNHDASPDNSTMGVATTSLTKNIVNLGVDWRHWSNMERLLRSILDYMDRNGGDVVPIELSEFNADAVGQRVDLSWATASELNSAMFEVEKAEMNEAGRSAFVKIDEVEAAGKSAVRREYGPVSDFDVTYGGTYVYRLRLIDNDGNYKYSDEKVVTLEGQTGYISLGEAKPNPAIDVVKLDLVKNADTKVEVALYDINGKPLDTQVTIGERTLEIDLENISNGSYTLVLRSGDVVITRQIRVVK